MPQYEKLRTDFASANPPRSLFPFLWLHGDEKETEEVLRREIAAMDEGGCGGVVIESRPHTDYLGERWWRDVGICLDEARQRGMDVWLFDEKYFPSGIAGGKVLDENPDFRMQVLVKESIRWPVDSEGTPPFEDRVADWDRVLKIVCFHVTDENIAVTKHSASFYNQASYNEWLIRQRKAPVNQTWEIVWIGLKKSWSGRMYDKMVDYLCPEITDRFIAITYEATKFRYGHLFGKTIKGFFGDETSFENFASFDLLFGEDTPCMPWSRVLLDSFSEDKGYNLLDAIEWLWYENPDVSAKTRYDFMDQMTRLFSTNFFGRIQRWCHVNGVKFIGHVVEDKQSHMHHGYGPGHFFRAARHFDTGGYDLVLREVDSEQKHVPYIEHFPQFAVFRDEPNPDFSHYTLAKLAQSAAHLEIQTDIVMCENFGAYGWDLGLKEMKWLTDWQTARGTNWYVPHAFSPIFPDPDCPPHFYAGGKNPQWPFFRQWADYANRSCLMLQKAEHICSIAVLYPAESHWAGDDVQLDRVCKVLMQHQYDFDILSCDLLMNPERTIIDKGKITIGKESFRVVILPGIETIPLRAMERLREFVLSGGQVIAVNRKLSKVCGENHDSMNAIMKELDEHIPVSDSNDLSEFPGISDYRCISTRKIYPDLRVCHYRKGEFDIFFLNNESIYDRVEDLITFGVKGIPEFWYPMDGSTKPAVIYDCKDTCTTVPIRLQPYEAVFLVFKPGTRFQPCLANFDIADHQIYDVLTDDYGNLKLEEQFKDLVETISNWEIKQISSPLPNAILEEMEPLTGLGDWRQCQGWDFFSGTVAYETVIETPNPEDRLYVLDLGRLGEIAVIWVNGVMLTTLLAPPYRVQLAQKVLRHRNLIRVEVTNTLGAYLREEGFNRDQPEASGLIGPVTVTVYSRRLVCP